MYWSAEITEDVAEDEPVAADRARREPKRREAATIRSRAAEGRRLRKEERLPVASWLARARATGPAAAQVTVRRGRGPGAGPGSAGAGPCGLAQSLQWQSMAGPENAAVPRQRRSPATQDPARAAAGRVHLLQSGPHDLPGRRSSAARGLEAEPGCFLCWSLE